MHSQKHRIYLVATIVLFGIFVLASVDSVELRAQLESDEEHLDSLENAPPNCNLGAVDFWYVSVTRLLQKSDMRWDSLLVRSQAARRSGDSIELYSDISSGPPAVFPLATRRLVGEVDNRIYFAFHHPTFYLSLTTLRDTIVAAGVTCDGKLVFSMLDVNRMSGVLEEYGKLYGTTIAITDTFMLPLESHVHSYACGEGASESNEYLSVLELMESRDMMTLRRWLHCMKPELQAFGVEGLLRLRSAGVALAPEDEKIIAMLRQSEMMLATCRGCVFGNQERMKEIISEIEGR